MANDPAARLSRTECSRDGCSNLVHLNARGKPYMYCSQSCNQMAYIARTRVPRAALNDLYALVITPGLSREEIVRQWEALHGSISDVR